MLQLVELLNRFGQWLMAHLWQMSIELAILAAVVAAVVWLLRVRSPALRHLFWGLVLAKPVATFLIASPISLYVWLTPEVPPPVSPVPPPVVVGESMPVPEGPVIRIVVLLSAMASTRSKIFAIL